MVFHLGGFEEDLDSAGVFANVAALADDRLFTQGDDLRVPELNRVIFMAAGAESTVAPRVRLTSPTLDAGVRPEIVPLNIGTADIEPASPHAIMDMRENPLSLGVDEILQAEINNNPGTIIRQWVLLAFADGPVQPISGQEILTVRAVGATTLVAETWTSVNIVLDENLTPGNYQLVGLHALGATLVAARVIFRTGNQWRPGCLGVDLIQDLADPMFRAGRLGVWGEFPFTQIPAMECLAVAADTAQVFHLDLIKVG